MQIASGAYQIAVASRIVTPSACRRNAAANAMAIVAMTILGDLFPGEKRATVQGYLSSTWALAALMGPLLGGVIVEQASWPWVFWINVPICLVLIGGFYFYFHETIERRHRSPVDIGGAILFTLAYKGIYFFGVATQSALPEALRATVVVNLLLAVFNMVPVPPLDGSRVMAWLLPDSLREPYVGLERWGMVLVLLLVFLVPGFQPMLWSGITAVYGFIDTITGGTWS